jgi:predicted subunit of tRNA(5-methylaminomethyl-2-thiouridylate) methyltransferase
LLIYGVIVPDDGPSPEAKTSMQQQFSAKDDELATRTTELAAETKRHNEAIQIIFDMKEEARVSAEQVRTLHDDIKKIDGVMKERVTYSERQREEDRQMIAEMRKMQKALQTRLAENT